MSAYWNNRSFATYGTWSQEERKQVVADYRAGMTIRDIGLKYRHHPKAVGCYLHALNIIRDRRTASVMAHSAKQTKEKVSKAQKRRWAPVAHVEERHPSPSLRAFLGCVARATQILGHAPDEAMISRVIEMVRQENGGIIRPVVRGDAA